MEPWDVVIIGGGILGTSVAYWIGNQYGGRVAVLEREQDVAMHTSRRNTGVVHRPFYLDPVKRRIFAKCSQAAYGMWKSYARERRLPWEPVTTLEVATRPEDVKRVEKYYHWGLQNGMGEDELQVLTAEDVRKLEPHVRGHGAIWSKTDTSVDYQVFTQAIKEDAGPEVVARLGGEVEDALAPYRKRLPARVLDQIRRESQARRLLEAHGLPRLSLFHAVSAATTAPWEAER